jgi:hypothetical protein
MSLISQQLKRTHITGNESGLNPNRVSSNPIGSGSRLVGERQVSSSSIGNGGSGRFTTPIDEEQGEFVFNMEGMEDVDEKKGEKRNSGGWTLPSTRTNGGVRNGASNGNGIEGMFGAR